MIITARFSRNPDCLSYNNILVSRKALTWRFTCLSNTREITGRIEIGLLLDITDLSPFLYIGITLAVLNNVGKENYLILQLNICTRIGATIAALMFKYFAETLSIPVVFPVSRCFSCFSTNWTETRGIVNLCTCSSFLELISASVVKSGLFVEFEEMYL